jgi:hypothetical protein
MERIPPYYVKEIKGWYYVCGGSLGCGPWRYHWEAQKYADERNAEIDERNPEICGDE